MIRMKLITKPCACEACGKTNETSLMMFCVRFNENKKVTLCDACNEELFNKALKGSCLVNNKIKSSDDLKIIRKRKEQHAKRF